MKISGSIDEKALLLKMKSGDKVAFETLYYHYSVEIYRRLLMMVKLTDIAEELTQEVFVKVWDKRSQIEATDSFKFFLYRLSKNMMIDFYRKAARNQQLQDKIIAVSTELSTDTEDSISYNETNAIFERALESLPSQQRQVFFMCKIEGLSYKEASVALGISTSTISNHIVKATKTLRQSIGNQGATLFLITSLLL